jgi:UDP-N-acetylmuramoyl-tripeptide--D-alanyl-D-alanine ligase
MLSGVNGVSIINDAYNASPTSMMAAVKVVQQMNGFSSKVLVLGDIYELGEQSKEFHESVAEVINASISCLFTVGEDSEVIGKAVSEKFPNMKIKHFRQKEDILSELQQFLKEDSLILFKASRGMKLETVIEKLI